MRALARWISRGAKRRAATVTDFSPGDVAPDSADAEMVAWAEKMRCRAVCFGRIAAVCETRHG